MRCRLSRLVPGLVLLAVAAGCQDDRPPETPTLAGPVVRVPRAPDTSTVDSDPPTPYDASPIVFDTTEPPEQIVQIPNRPLPPPPAPPTPTPRPPPPAPPPGPSGSCDVRASEGFCFAYTGSGWTRESATDHCDAAPNAVYGAGSCPLRGRIATCTFRRPSDPERELVYTYYEPYDLALAELACPGTFSRVR